MAHDLSFECASCGQTHVGLFDLACQRPDHWPDGDERGPNALAASSSHFLSEDFCVLHGEHFFVRCVIALPIIGRPGERFAYGVWSTLSQTNFSSYVESFDTGFNEQTGPWFGWLSNRLPGYPDTLNMKCNVFPQPGRNRPLIRLQDDAHPLAREINEGISLDRLVDIYRAFGHDIRMASLGAR